YTRSKEVRHRVNSADFVLTLTRRELRYGYTHPPHLLIERRPVGLLFHDERVGVPLLVLLKNEVFKLGELKSFTNTVE
ncbi:MAG: hypothetical protein ACK55I_51510, partial [bacterium]